MKKKASLFLVLIVLVASLPTVAKGSCSWEIDMTAFVSRIIDGDTFELASGDRVRLADVDTPEVGEVGYSSAKNRLIDLAHGRTVHLDIDDVYGTDKYGRLVCVVYVDYNSTHVMNVNKALLVGNYARIWNFNNEFNPYTWSLYCPKEQEQQTKPFLSPLEILIITIIVIGVIVDIYLFVEYRKRKRAIHLE